MRKALGLSRRRVLAVVALLLLFGVLPQRQAAAEGPKSFVFTSGPEESAYHVLADALALEVRRECAGCRLRVVTSQGSYENAARLRNGAADVAILQSDVAFLEHFEDRSFRAVAPLFTEPIHILARRELGLERLSDLEAVREPLRIALGPDGSGSASNALTVLEELRVDPGRFELHRIALSEALERLRLRDLDIAFVTAAPPVRSLQPAARQGIFNLLEIDADLARRMARKYPFFTPAEIPYQAYGTRGRNVQTLGPRTVLVVSSRADPKLVRGLLGGLERIASEARARGIPQLTDWAPGTGLDDLPIPLHETARVEHAQRMSALGRWFRRYRGYVTPVLVLLTPLLVLARFSRIAYFIHQFALGRIFCLLVVVWLVGAAAMHLIEGAKNSSFRSFGQSAIAILHYLFSGLESKYPITLAGNVVAILLLTLGVGIVTLFTATLVTQLVERALEVRKIRPKPWRRLRLKNHVLLIGWSERAERVLEQLRSEDLPHKPAVVVVPREEGGRPPETRRPYRDTWLVEGDIADDETLARADAAHASCALMLAGDRGDPRPDLRTVASTLAVESFAPGVRTVVEVREPAAMEHLRRAGVDEIVETRALGEKLLTQCIVAPGITEVFRELLTFGRDSQEIHAPELPESLDGVAFREIRRRLAPRSVIPIGYRRARGSSTVLNPRPEGDGAVPLTRGDRLLMIADEPGLSTRRRLLARFLRTAGPPRGGPVLRSAPRPQRRRLRVGICGWTPAAFRIAGCLESWASACGRDLSLVVIGAAEGDVRALAAEGGSRFEVVSQDPRSRRGYEWAGVSELDCLLILAARNGEREGDLVDHDSLLVALAASEARPDLHLVVELVDSRSRAHFARLPAAEVVSTDEIAEKVLAQAAVTPWITAIFMDLLTAEEGSNEIYLSPVPDRWVGRSFQSVHEELIDRDEPAIALGYRVWPPEGGRPVCVVNPASRPAHGRRTLWGRDYELGKEDDLIFLADAAPAW